MFEFGWLYHLGLCLFCSRMSQKRQGDDGDGIERVEVEGGCGSSSVDKGPKHQRSFRDTVQLYSFQQRLVPILEPLIRRVVKEELEQALTKYVKSFEERSAIDVFPAESRSLQLRFLNTLSLPVFTGTRIEGEDGSPIKIPLVDSLTEEAVQAGPESSAKVEIVALEGGFDSEGESWTQEVFQCYIVREREDKKSLLAGDTFVNLIEGVGQVGEISFTDNSSWTRNRRFRLGARLVRNPDEPMVREAKTEPFIVRDHRGECEYLMFTSVYRKHYPPKLSDEVWRLEKIGKDGAFHKRLSKEHVKSVREFLILLHVHPEKLRAILGSGMSTRMWEVAVEHARTCVLHKRVYLYTCPSIVPGKGVAFNEVGNVIGGFSETQYLPADELPEKDKIDAVKLVISAFQNRERVLSFEDVDSFLSAFSQALTSRSSDSQKTPKRQSALVKTRCMGSSDNYMLDSIECVDFSFHHLSDLAPRSNNSIISDTKSMARAFLEDNLGVLDMACSIESPNPMVDYSLPVSLDAITVGGAGRRRWTMLFSIVKWVFLMRKAHCKGIERC
ncbi:Calmodulin-binding protein 60 A-like protein [Drosera capensis]